MLAVNTDYSPATGRFLSKDPIKDGLNWYGYAGNNPIKNIDPSGLGYFDKDGKWRYDNWEYIGDYQRPGKYSLSIYSDKNNGHSFVLTTNYSNIEIIVGAVILKPGMSATIGTYGNRISEHNGIFYNLEATSNSKMDNYVSLTMDLQYDQISTINDFIAENDRWSIYNNCSSFAVGLWNSVSDITLSDGFWWNTPSGLADSIMKQNGYSTGRKFGVADSYGWENDGKFYSSDSANSINSGSSIITASSSSGYGAYLTPGSSSDSSSGYSSNSSGSSSGSSGSNTGSSMKR